MDSGWSAPAVVYFCIETSNLSATGFISWTDATLVTDELKQCLGPCACNSASQSVWTRPGAPIQTHLSAAGLRALWSSLKSSLFTVGLRLAWCHVTLWPSEGDCWDLYPRTERLSYCESPHSRLGFSGLHHFLNVLTRALGSCSKSSWCVPAWASHTTEQFSFGLPPTIFHWSINKL